MKYTIGRVSKLTGVSVRTLHYYDEIGLLKPEETTPSGYRLYGQLSLDALMQIMFLRELDMPLSDIAKIINDPSFEKKQALQQHCSMLKLKRSRLEKLITLAENALKGDDTTMDFKAFDNSEYEKCREQYAQEAKERWGHTEAYKQSQQRQAGMGKQQQRALDKETQEIFTAFAKAISYGPESPQAQELCRRWQAFINDNYYDCSKEMLQGLAQMYVEDERFRDNLDKYGAGNAKFMHDAIMHYCKEQH